MKIHQGVRLILSPVALLFFIVVNIEICAGQVPIESADPGPSLTPARQLKESWQSTGKVDWKFAAILGLLSKTAYEDDHEMMKFLAQGMGFEECQIFKMANSAAYALIGDEVVVIAFRGTEFTSLSDWQTDAYTKFKLVPGVGRMHSGFYNAYEDVRRDVEHTLRNHEGKKIWLTGHSLGGAMAVVCAVQLNRKNLGRPHIVTFGQPRVGDNSTARWIDGKFFRKYQRIVNDNDIVPRLPPTWYFQYADAGRYAVVGQQPNAGAVGGPMDGQPDQETNSLLTTARPQVLTAPIVGPTAAGGAQDDLNTVYQSKKAALPISRAELEELIPQESEFRSSLSRGSIYFPSDDELEPETPLAVGGTSSIQPVAGSWFNWTFNEYVTDHLMAGYLKLIRDYRDR